MKEERPIPLALNLVLAWLLVLMAGAIAPGPCVASPAAGDGEQPQKSIYLVSHGWHAGVVVNLSDVPADGLPMLEDFHGADHLEIGWGDLEFYQTPEPAWRHYLEAALVPTASVLHVVGFNGPVTAFFPRSEIIELRITATGLAALLRAIGESFSRNAVGRVEPLGPGIYGNSLFYPSGERYHLLNTCNVWTARKLRSAGLPFDPARSLRVKDLMRQARQLGRVVQPAR